jgi:hypothetical protein
MAQTIPPYNVNSVTFTPYVVQSECTSISTAEVAQAATTDYYVQTLDQSGVAGGTMTIPAGNVLKVSSPWKSAAVQTSIRVYKPGDTPFQIKTVSGSIQFGGIEE